MSESARQNLEIKVRLTEVAYRQVEESLTKFIPDDGLSSIDTDTYFRVARGRLKLRSRDGQRIGTLIAYERRNEAVSRLSRYRLHQISEVDALCAMLEQALGVLVTVRKHRTVFMFGQTRIHLDIVDQLGCFVELETVITTQSEEVARAEHQLVFNRLGLAVGEIVPESYSDLILQRGDAPTSN